MAETAKILSPEKTVLIPSLEAGCSLAASITAEDVRELRERFPGVPVVTYVNTYADIKAESDVCCTSSNALAVIESFKTETVIFLPDEYLAKNVARESGKHIIFSHRQAHSQGKAGSSHGLPDPRLARTSARFTRSSTWRISRTCAGSFPTWWCWLTPSAVRKWLRQPIFRGSTSAMIRFVEQARSPRYLLLTECSMADNVAAENPDKEMLRLVQCSLPPHESDHPAGYPRFTSPEPICGGCPGGNPSESQAGGGPDAGDPLSSPPGLSPGTSILLTGGAGFIGSHLAERLIGAGARVTVLDDLNDAYSTHRKRENLRQVSEQGSFDFLQVDIANHGRAAGGPCPGKTYEILIHLAARTGVRSSLDCPPVVRTGQPSGHLEPAGTGSPGNVPEVHLRVFQLGLRQDQPSAFFRRGGPPPTPVALWGHQAGRREALLLLRPPLWAGGNLSTLFFRLRPPAASRLGDSQVRAGHRGEPPPRTLWRTAARGVTTPTSTTSWTELQPLCP